MNRRQRNAELTARAGKVSSTRILISGLTVVFGGVVMMIGTHLPFNNSAFQGGGVISRNAYQMGPLLTNNGVGVIDSVLALMLVALGAASLTKYRGFWFNPYYQGLNAVVAGVIIFGQKDYNLTNIAGISYSHGSGWYLCLVGALLCFIATMIRFPGKSIESTNLLSPDDLR